MWLLLRAAMWLLLRAAMWLLLRAAMWVLPRAVMWLPCSCCLCRQVMCHIKRGLHSCWIDIACCYMAAAVASCALHAELLLRKSAAAVTLKVHQLPVTATAVIAATKVYGVQPSILCTVQVMYNSCLLTLSWTDEVHGASSKLKCGSQQTVEFTVVSVISGLGSCFCCAVLQRFQSVQMSGCMMSVVALTILCRIGCLTKYMHCK